mgnify:CR=1 FL=1
MLKIYIEKVNHGKNFSKPQYETSFSSGVDLKAGINKTIKLKISEIKLIPAGIKVIIPKGYEGQIRSRSGLALNHGISVLNSPGTIDSDYRGEIGIVLINLGKSVFKIDPGMRIAQLVFTPVIKCIIEETKIDSFETKRNRKGFGSTGLN